MAGGRPPRRRSFNRRLGRPLNTGWDELLDQMERRLAMASSVGDHDAVVVEPFVLPTGLGPLPPRLRDRAAALLEATRAEEYRLALQMGEVALRLQAGEMSGRASDRPPPTYVDTVA